ncbi:hypothetical protein [Bradyrhizobium uaiense]|uniref:Uncharacterized protein n=1 Tax=Bradyrhizobium uaiense TaxID=2594946 RepID=A0A6P1BF95_9BRAD|nr:hypothetical protein [Bradyrhizobium uaiense]NEU96152.1 hypothetical protein [Bradyrhizobium uaiense]
MSEYSRDPRATDAETAWQPVVGRAIDPSALPVECKNSKKQAHAVPCPSRKAIAELTLLKVSVEAIADAGSVHRALMRFAMTDRMKLLAVEQPVKYEADSGCERSADRRWLLDALEDDEVREALKDAMALTSSETDGMPAHD